MMDDPLTSSQPASSPLLKDEVLTPGEIHSLGDFSKDAPGNETPSPINTNAPSTPLVTPPTPTSRKAVSTLLQLVDQVIDSQDEEEAKQFIDKSHEGTSATNAEIVYKSMLARHAATLRFISSDNNAANSDWEIAVMVPGANAGSIPPPWDPYKQNAPENFIYTVQSKHKRTLQEYSVARRFLDFCWLYELLKTVHPPFVIPSVPDHVQARFAAMRPEYRTRELTKFLTRIACHPILCVEEKFISFLTTLDSKELLQAGFKVEPPPFVANPSIKLISHTTSSTLTTIMKRDFDSNPFFPAFRKTVDFIQHRLELTAQSNLSLINTWRGMKDYYASIADTYKKLSETHKSWDISVSESCQKISITADSDESLNMEDQFRDFAREVAEMRNVLDRRIMSMHHYKSLLQALAAKRDKVSKLKSSKQESYAKTELNETEKLCNRAKEEYDEFTTTTINEIKRAQEIRRSEFTQTLQDFIAAQVEFHAKLETAFGKEFSEEEISTTSESSVAAQQPTESIPEQDTEDSDFAFGLPAPAT